MQSEGIGKNIEQAIDNALFELKAVRDDVDIKILDEGGLFRKAKVLVTISEDAIEKYKKREESRKKEIEETEKVSEKQENEEIEKPSAKKAVRVEEEYEQKSDVNQGRICQEFLENLLINASIEGEVDVTEKEEEILVSINGDKAELLVGYRGENLNALQYLTSIVLSKNNRHSKKVRIDVNNYRAKREQTLIALAGRIAKKVEKTGHSCKLEPMSANERRIIHTALQSSETVTTESHGEEPYRYLVVMPK